MLFTRQPIIETIITPKEGFQLQLKGSQSAGREDYLADALELVIYGDTPFYRSLEGPRPFLIPAAQFEVEQVREGRALLKHATYERKAARESMPREPKKTASPLRERSGNSREEKNEGPSTGDNWERRKHARKRTSANAQTSPKPASKSSHKAADAVSESPSHAQTYEAFHYDLVPPPETFVSESMENLQKSKERSLKKETVDRTQGGDDEPLDPVEAILKASDTETTSP